MNYLPQQPEQPEEQQMTPEQRQNAQADKILEEILGGQIPGEGYLFPAEPRKRTVIPTDADTVRAQLLRSIETLAIGLQLPYGAQKIAEVGKAILESSQAYLLLDPEVDNEGVPVAEKITAQAQASHEKTALDAHAKAAASHLETKENAQFEKPVTETGYKEPPRRKLPPAAQKVREKNKPKSEILRGARGSKPTPQPRSGA